MFALAQTLLLLSRQSLDIGSTSYEIPSPVECIEKGLVRLTEVTGFAKRCFVDSFGGVRQVFESSCPTPQEIVDSDAVGCGSEHHGRVSKRKSAVCG